MQTEPRGAQALVHHVQPQRHLRQLAGGVVQVHAVTAVQRQVGLHLLQLVPVRLRVDRGIQLALPPLQVLVGELVDRLVEERATAHRGLTHPVVEKVARGRVVVDQLGQRMLHHRAGQHLRRVVRGAALPIAARKAVDERAHRVHDETLLTGQRVLPPHHVLLVVLAQLLALHQPRALGRITVLGELHQLPTGDETAVGHQPLVHRAELVDAQLRVRHVTRLAALALRRLRQQQQRQHPLQHRVAQIHVVDVVGVPPIEQVGPQRLEHQAVAVGLARVMTGVDQVEQQPQRIVQVVAIARGTGEGAQDQLPQPVEAVADVVVRVPGREDAQLRPRLRIQQEQDAVEKPQRLRGELARQLGDALHRLALGAPLPDHLVGDQLHRHPQALPQVLTHAHRVLDGVVGELAEQAVPVLRGQEHVRRRQTGDPREFTGGLVVAT